MTMTENFKVIHPILDIISDAVTNNNEELFRKARKMSIDAFLSNKITESEFDSLIITIASIFSVFTRRNGMNANDIASGIRAMPAIELVIFIVALTFIVIAVIIIAILITMAINEKKDMPDLMKVFGWKKPKTIRQWIRHLFVETFYPSYVFLSLASLNIIISSVYILKLLVLRHT